MFTHRSSYPTRWLRRSKPSVRSEDLVSPNLFHHLFLRGAIDRWPEARFHSSLGLAEKRSDLPGAEPLKASGSWQGAFSVVPVEGMPKFQEFAFLHEPSRTLIVTDLVFNEPHGLTLSTRLFFRVFGTYGKLAVSRLFTSMVKDKQAFAESLRTLSQLEIDRVVMAHGKVLSENAQQRFREVLAAHTAGLKSPHRGDSFGSTEAALRAIFVTRGQDLFDN